MTNDANDIWSQDAEAIKAFIRVKFDKIEAFNAEAAEHLRRHSPRSFGAIAYYDGFAQLMRELKTEIFGDPPCN